MAAEDALCCLVCRATLSVETFTSQPSSLCYPTFKLPALVWSHYQGTIHMHRI